jgi:hypothetical protein
MYSLAIARTLSEGFCFFLVRDNTDLGTTLGSRIETVKKS